MCKFRPFNKHLLVQKIAPVKNRDLSPVLIPEGAKMENNERYCAVKFLCAATDCELFLRDLDPATPSWATQHGTMDDVFTTSAKKNGNASLVVDKSMIEEVKINDKVFHIVHQNYVVGVIDE